MADESALPPARHEPTDISRRVLWIGAPALIVVVIALALLVLALFPGQAVDRTLHLPLPHYPAPELQVSPREDMEKFRAEQSRWINGTGWIDKTHGVVHIPIEDAMREVAAEGIPGWPMPATEKQETATHPGVASNPP
jgi:hypothetical protein